jgi:hypothetical protein
LVYFFSAGEGLESAPFSTTGILDARSAPNGAWSLSLAGNGRVGWSQGGVGGVTSIFRGGPSNASLAGEDWHVIIATWDGSEIPADNAGDDRNMRIFVDDLDQNAMRQGPRGLFLIVHGPTVSRCQSVEFTQPIPVGFRFYRVEINWP